MQDGLPDVGLFLPGERQREVDAEVQDGEGGPFVFGKVLLRDERRDKAGAFTAGAEFEDGFDVLGCDARARYDSSCFVSAQ